MSESHTIMDGKVHVYRRENSRFWQCAIFLSARNFRASTRQTNLALALDVAREWAMDRLAEDRLQRRGFSASLGQQPVHAAPPPAPQRPAAVPKEKTFAEAADAFLAEYEVMTLGERNPRWVKRKSEHVRLYLKPFFGDAPISEITAGRIQEYRLHRLNPPAAPAKRQGTQASRRPKAAKRPARSTLHQEIVTLRQVLKTANRNGWIAALPDMSAPYKGSGKIARRAWFSPEEYKRLYEATRARAQNPKRERWRKECEQLHDYVLFMVNTGLRPDEASRLEFRDVNIVTDDDTGERILQIEVRGKRGFGYCKSMPGAVPPYQRVRKRKNGAATDRVFGDVQRELLNNVLKELGLKRDRDGNLRTAYSLRHTYICLRLMEGADIYQVAKNCRTSVEMIQKFYAAHIANTLNAAAINVRRKAKTRKGPSAREALASA